MSLLEPTRSAPLTKEPTAPYPGPQAEPDRGLDRLQVALVPRAGLQPVEEIQRLLRTRLRFFALLICGGLAVLLLFVLGPAVHMAGDNVLEALGVQVYFAVMVVAAASAVILYSKRSLSLAQLRALEMAVFGTLVASGVFMHYDFFVRYWVVVVADQGDVTPGRDVFFGLLLAAAESLPWVFLIVVYGTVIPNTWRRCATFVGAMAAIPLGLNVASFLTDSNIPSRPFVNFMLFLGTWMVFAVAMAVYGAYRIEVLRQEAFEARQLGQYRLKERLGAGGMGEVYLAEHVLLRRPCAIKLIRPERAGDAEHLRRFEREVRTTATLTHPNTVQVFDYGHADDGTFYYVMEYLPGLTLGQLVERHGPLPPARAIHFLRQLCGALREAHAVGLIHRDIKPGNIMVCRRGGLDDVAKLLDFGLVLPLPGGADGDKLTQLGAVPGTPAYMSPEQAAGQEDVDARSDLYSVGALAYFLLTGQPPFAGRSSLQMLAAHLYEAPRPLTEHRAGVPADLAAVVLRCLAKKPAERYADAESLEAALASCRDAEGWSAKVATGWWDGQTGANGGGQL